MTNTTIRFFSWGQKHSSQLRWLMVPVILGLMIGVFALVYATGGIKYVFSHSMYIPVLLGGLVFGVAGGILIGLLGGVVLGPMMPIDTVSGEMQLTINWLYRMGFFVLIGAFAGVASDGIRQYIKHLYWVSRHDEHSGLPNHRALNDVLAKPHNEPAVLALVLVSVENISELKVAFGPQVAHTVIRQLADYSYGMLFGLQLVCRSGSQDFCFLVATHDSVRLNKELQQLIGIYQEPVYYQEIPLHVDIKIAVVGVEPGNLAEACLQRAESTLLLAREKGQHLANYTSDNEAGIHDTIHLLGELKHALETGQLEMYYQPKVCARDGHVQSVEALIRWQHPEMGSIPPGKFIPRAEKSTLINQLTDYALDASLAQLVRWREAGIELGMAVNVSAGDLVDPEFAARVTSLLEKHGVPGHLLELEITEGSLIFDANQSISELTSLSGANISIAIDDFGTGYSSLKYLHALPASVLKVDQSFIFALPNDESAASIVEMARPLASRLGMRIVAEGVETLEALDFLVAQDFDLLQGYLIAAPMAAEDFTRWYLDLPTPGYWHPSR
ncbi:putative bifunctional diguanylate cyclase/phosphodiesterase [Porticoccus sp.]|uniref:putative bifunctional diguanylate cyclase/phosphodiesterase n=1 Tax=Porticoccus sp. TaxID=2024853 RepID=UPI003F69DD43